jgi:protein SCO1/2
MMRHLARAACVAAIAALAAPLAAAETAKLGFVPPAPGSYKLERIMRAPDGEVLESDGSVHRLSEFSTGKITLFSFIYTYCTDARGCPLAYQTLHGLKKAIGQDPAMHGKVRFVSMSFDPRFDTPQAMRSYGGEDAREVGGAGGVRWHFLTTASGSQLAPVLDGFGQDVSVAAPRGPEERVPTLSHMLKVYLIDPGGSVREIYSPAFLHQQVLLNDIKTLLLERPARVK